VDTVPGFLLQDETETTERTFSPAAVDRRGEGVGWLLTAGLAAGLAVIFWRSGGVPWLGLVLLVILIGLSSLVSLGNWLESNTTIRLDVAGIEERQPLHSVALRWDEILELWAWPASRGWRILVRGTGGQILFRTGERLVSARGPELRLGFPQGEQLAARVRNAAQLAAPQPQEAGWVCRRTESKAATGAGTPEPVRTEHAA
jgi:hypothetical protein